MRICKVCGCIVRCPQCSDWTCPVCGADLG